MSLFFQSFVLRLPMIVSGTLGWYCLWGAFQYDQCGRFFVFLFFQKKLNLMRFDLVYQFISCGFFERNKISIWVLKIFMVVYERDCALVLVVGVL